MITLRFKNQRGVGLIEVLITLLILSTSLLAMGALQSRSLQFNHSAYLRSQANLLAYDMLDRMRIANTVGPANDDEYLKYEGDYAEASPGGSGLVGDDLNDWMGLVSGLLPGGQASIDCENRVCTISISWVERDDPSAEVEDEGEQERATFSYSSRV